MRAPSTAMLVLVGAVALTVWRSVTPLVEQQLNSDEALVGLMAKHLLEGRAFPLHLYSLPHMLGIGSWIAALFFAIGGATVAMLKLPLVLINVTIAWLLVDRLQRDAHLRALPALVAALPFILAPPILSHAHYLDAAGGSPEPLLFVLLLWVLRERPLAFGIVLGIGVLNRPFVAYGAAALVIVQCWDRSILQRRVWRGWIVATIAAVAIWDLNASLRAWSSPRGPGTVFDGNLPDTVAANTGFVCFDPSAVLTGTWTFGSEVLPYMLGASQPMPTLPFIVLLVVAAIGARWLWLARTRGAGEVATRYGFPVYLIVVGVVSAEVYVAARCGIVDVQTLRYALLTPFAIVGVLAILCSLEPSRSARRLVAGAVCVWAAVQFVQHTQLLAAALAHGATSPRRDLARYLEAHDVRYAWADYWDSLTLTFLTGERVIVASEGVVRIETYQRQVSAAGQEAVRIRQVPCVRGGVEAVPRIYWVCSTSD